MALISSIDWENRIINISRSDMLLIQSSPSEIRQLDTDAFRLELKAQEASETGAPFLDTHQHNTTVTVGGVTLARVIEIINDYTITFEDGQYAVNLVGSNNNIADVTNVNQVSVRSANSAGLTYSDAINKQSFQGGVVYVDPQAGLPGTSFPRGTPSDEVNNYLDAKSIADLNGYDNFHLDGILEVPIGQNLSGQSWVGDNYIHSQINFNNNNTYHADVQNMFVSGTVTGGAMLLMNCLVGSISGFEGAMRSCQIRGNVTVTNNPQEQMGVSLFNCASNVAGNATPILDFNSANCDGEVRAYAGGLEIRNFNQGNNLSIDMIAGHVKLHPSCTNGEIVIRGNCKITNSSSYYANVNTEHVINVPVEDIKKNTNLIPATL